jgi:C1A family cysteine protease
MSADKQFVELLAQDVQRAASHSCKVHLPYPFDVPVPTLKQPSKIPSTFAIRLNYKKKLKECQCNAIYQQYSSQQLRQLREKDRLGTLVPRFAIAPVNADIAFLTKSNTYSISNTELEQELYKSKSLPNYFNWHDSFSELSAVVSQGMCGQCWAVATATCLSDLFAIQKGIKNPKLSPTFLLSCYPQGRCDGGDPFTAVQDIKKNGIQTTDCINDNWCGVFTGCGGNTTIPFDPKKVNDLVPKCNGCMNTSVEHKKYYIEEARSLCIPPDLTDIPQEDHEEIKSYLANLYGKLGSDYADLSKLHYKDIQSLIKHHIYTKGPVIGGMHIFNNFFRDDFAETNQIYVETQTYKGVLGVDYSKVEEHWAGSHAVVLVGWGKEMVKNEEVEYWIIRNSWGVSWGADGYCKIAMYGKDPNKVYQNRFSQFEYPSVLYTDEGIMITGGVIMITPGRIEEIKPTLPQRITHITQTYQSQLVWGGVFLLLIYLFSIKRLTIPLLIAFLLLLWYFKK